MAIAQEARPMTPEEKKVIFASSLGTVFEWYDFYLYGSLVHTAPYLKNDERVALWDGMYQSILRDLEVQSDRALRPQSKLVSARKSF